MFECILLIGLWISVGRIVRRKGRPPLWWQVSAVAAWLAAEIVGVVIARAVMSGQGVSFAGNESFFFLALFGPLCGTVGGAAVWLIAGLLPPSESAPAPGLSASTLAADKLVEMFGIDVRSLAVYRVLTAGALLADLAIRATDMRQFYTDEGILPVAEGFAYWGDRWRWSPHLLDGSLEFQAFLFILAGLCAGAMLVGYRTRLATIASWMLLISLHTRQPMVLNGGDVMFRVVLFWAMFLPLGRAWSIDALRRSARGIESTIIASPATVAILLQVCLVYWCTGMFKWNSDWHSGDAMFYVMSFEAYGRPLAGWLVNFPWLLAGATWSTILLELGGPLLAFAPWRTRYYRLLVVAAFVGLHAGIELTMTVGMFSYVSIAAWMLFVPSMFWEGRAFAWLRRSEQEESAPRGQIAPWLARAGAWGRIGGEIVAGAAVVVLLAYVIWWNAAAGIPSSQDGKERILSREWQQIGYATGLGQKWDMFSRPTKDDGWFVADATLRDGSHVDLLQAGGPVTDKKPALISTMYPNHRQRKFYRYMRDKRFRRYWRPSAEYLCRQWNEQHLPERQAVSLVLIYYKERTRKDPSEIEVVREEVISIDVPAGDGDEGIAQAD